MRIERGSKAHLLFTPLQKSPSPLRFGDSLTSASSCKEIFRTLLRKIWDFLTSLFWICGQANPLSVTKQAIRAGKYTIGQTSYHFSAVLSEAKEQTEQFDIVKPQKTYPFYKQTLLQVKNGDWSQICKKLEGRALIHDNLEDILIRTSLIEIVERRGDLFCLNEQSVVYSPRVPILRGPVSHQYPFLTKSRNITLITSHPSKNWVRIWNELFAAYEKRHPNVVFLLTDQSDPDVYLSVIQNFFGGSFKTITFVMMDKKQPFRFETAIGKIGGKVQFK